MPIRDHSHEDIEHSKTCDPTPLDNSEPVAVVPDMPTQQCILNSLSCSTSFAGSCSAPPSRSCRPAFDTRGKESHTLETWSMKDFLTEKNSSKTPESPETKKPQDVAAGESIPFPKNPVIPASIAGYSYLAVHTNTATQDIKLAPAKADKSPKLRRLDKAGMAFDKIADGITFSYYTLRTAAIAGALIVGVGAAKVHGPEKTMETIESGVNFLRSMQTPRTSLTPVARPQNPGVTRPMARPQNLGLTRPVPRP